MHLLTPILPYLTLRKLVAVCVINVKNAKNANFDANAIRHVSLIDMAYGNMCVKTCVRTSGMKTNLIKLLVHGFNGLKCQNTDLRKFPLYF